LKNFTSIKCFTIFLAFVILTFSQLTIVHADELKGRTLENELRVMMEKGILTGYEDGKIRPEEAVTRGQFAAFIARALDLPEGLPAFSDVPSSLNLAQNIYKVNAAGLMEGSSDNTFKPNELITREQLMISMTRVYAYTKMELKEERIDFSDADEFISSGGIRATFNSIHYKVTKGMLNEDGVTFRFEPKSDATREQAAAFLYRFLEAKESYVPPVIVVPPVEPEPPVEPPVDPTLFQLATISSGKLVKTTNTYQTYEQALAAFNSNSNFEALYRGDEIMKIKPGGIAFGNNKTATGGIANTNVYFDTNFTQQATYMERGREMRYLDSNAEYIRVQVAATIGYVKHSETDLKPKSLLLQRDYYDVSQWGTLIHHIVNHYTNKSTSYAIGPAPTFLIKGIPYYSHDSVHFINEKGQGVGTNLPYFQYLSARTTTSYTAEELDAHIFKLLTEKYGVRASESKLMGMGAHFKKLEQEKRINALLILSLAIHESAYGMSDRALQCNNLFGLHIYDSVTKTCPKDGTFESPEEGANKLVDNFWNSRYVNPEFLGVPARNMGAAFGNKTTGFNVNYASDPTWGAKAGAHMLKLDADLGGKDLNKFKTILFTKFEGATNIRKEPSTLSEVLYSYRPRNVGVYKDSTPPNGYPLGYPLTVVDSVQDGQYTWYKVYSDKFVDSTSPVYGWIRSDVVNVITY